MTGSIHIETNRRKHRQKVRASREAANDREDIGKVHQLSDNIWKVLACPNCGFSLDKTSMGAVCNQCRVRYIYTNSGALDLRLGRPKKYLHEFNLGTPLLPESGFDFGGISENDTPEVSFSNFHGPLHLTKEIMSHFPKAKGSNSLMLDLGCGSTRHRRVCEYAGFEYVGLDYKSPEAPILGDAHSLPFRDESFEFILSIAVLEHIRFPIVMMKEAHRVLKPGCKLIGSVAFLEPFHGDSFYHHTHLGIYNSLHEGGFGTVFIAPNDKWTVLIAQASIGLFPKMPALLSKSLVLPLQMLHILWWRLGRKFNPKASERNRLLHTTGHFDFIALREDICQEALH